LSNQKNNISKKIRQAIQLLISIAIDFAIIIVAFFITFYIHSNSVNEGFSHLETVAITVLIVCLFSVLVFYLLNFYNKLWRYAGIVELLQLGGSAAASTFIAIIVFNLTYALKQLPKYQLDLGQYLNYLLVLFAMICAYRFAFHFLISQYSASKGNNANNLGGRVMVVGAGSVGSAMISLMKNSDYVTGIPILVVDDNPAKLNSYINGVPVRGSTEQIPKLAEKYKIDKILFAIPSATQEQFKRITEYALQTTCKITSVPSLNEITQQGADIHSIKEIDFKDLLFRPQSNLYEEHLYEYINGSIVLVTGGGGSIGSELCRQIAPHKPSKIIIFDVYENNAFELLGELKPLYPNIIIELRIGSVRDIARLEEIFKEFKPDIVFHAAAHKHVPLMEASPKEAVKNNVLGTLNVAESARKFKTKKFVLLSTDKAVNPTNVMGATKRVAELIVQHISLCPSETCFAAVRFGNVLGSNGSVIPIFKKQIAAGGPVTVTHPDVTRFFMTIPEAAQLVIKAGALAKGGDIFVLDMGEPIKIAELAKNVIRLSGFLPDKDIKIEYIGLRPGEKLYEELYQGDENNERETTADKKIFVLKPVKLNEDIFWQRLDKLKNTCDASDNSMRRVLLQIVPGFKPEQGIEDEEEEL